ncbi:putative trichoplein keratin filament-binding protein-like isoform X2 [Apostichopus japonicus]|uniref:Trichoplein keratin filament-binding protein n=1 Tax=Stichopus japonicus TaxID=307972 RepID=A0A2G8KFB6_STIJA|nr:putative trichoplein keratin filament-binding protein-like isoform X2 [Apostichopus japonicus]
MALPTIPSYWSSRYRNIQERAMVQRRTHEADFRETWSDRASYFNKSEVRTVKQNAWTSDRSFQDSMDAVKRQGEKDLKAMRLERRRSQLKRLLKKETDMYEAELKGLSRSNFDRLEEMRDRSEEMKSARETDRKEIADVKMYEHWKRNNPDLRKMESDRHKRHVITAWGSQREENEKKRKQEEEDRRHLEEEMERERLAALEEERQMQESRLANEKEVAGALKMQIDELKRREEEAERLKKQQEELQRQEWQLADLEEKRKEAEIKRKKEEMSRQLTRQYKVQLRRRAKQVQEALVSSRSIYHIIFTLVSSRMHLSYYIYIGNGQKDSGIVVSQGGGGWQLKTARKEKAKADAAWMKQVVEEQLRLEKAREAELDMLYRSWQYLVYWPEIMADNLSGFVILIIAIIYYLYNLFLGMKQPVSGRNEKENGRRENSQRETYGRGVRKPPRTDKRQNGGKPKATGGIATEAEELLREMEIGQQLTRRDKEEAERRKEETRRDLGGQITERRIQQDMAHLQLEDDLQREKEAEDVYEDMLQQEAARLEESDYEPKSYPRPSSRPNTRRSAWD